MHQQEEAKAGKNLQSVLPTPCTHPPTAPAAVAFPGGTGVCSHHNTQLLRSLFTGMMKLCLTVYQPPTDISGNHQSAPPKFDRKLQSERIHG